MKQFFRTFFLFLVPNRIKKILVNDFFSNLPETQFGKVSFSQEGEDLILLRYFNSKRDGFFVDVGAHHPYRFSNTYYLYKNLGWTGINIDAMPDSMVLFNSYRPKDINIESGISNFQNELEFFIFDEPALNTFDSKEKENYVNSGVYKLIKTKSIKTYPLNMILQNYLPKNQNIDFISIDVEGLDLEVLMSNDWKLYKPKLILVEVLGLKYSDIFHHPVTIFLKNHGYNFYAKTVNTVFYELHY